jgi:hypothetical protein
VVTLGASAVLLTQQSTHHPTSQNLPTQLTNKHHPSQGISHLVWRTTL